MIKIFCHRYKVSHIKRRKVMKRAAKNGLCKMKEINQDGFLYEISQENLKLLPRFKR